MRKRTHNPKREISPMSDKKSLSALAKRIRYVGSPFHKRNPGDFGLVPPAQPRPDKTLCDGVQIFERQVAQNLLEEGVKAGLVSVQRRGDFPQNIWTVSPGGIALEAQLDNADRGTYHGYPMGDGDPFAKKVQERWEQRLK
ncbi:MAG: hypothetical protein BGO25_15425 [Acidobacteriales bacterium 59-55]|nr:MAG: hypothetical protein BGO25_15425 [Acidobacteriales bacterium 59-55]